MSGCRSGFALLVGIVAFVVLAPGSASASAVYVAMANDGVLLPIDGSGPISVVQDAPRTLAIAIAPDGETAYVDDPGAGTVVPVDLATSTAGIAIPVGDPEPAIEGTGAIAITPDGSRAYVLASGGLTPVDLATRQALSPIPVPADATGLAIAPDGGTAYVTDYAEGTVTPVDLSSGRAEAPIVAGPSPGALAITPDGQTAYVADQGGVAGAGEVTPIDLATRTPEAAITTAGTSLTALAISPDGTRAYVADGDDHVIPIDLVTRTAGTPIRPIPSPPPPPGTTPWAPNNGITFSPDGQTVYVIENCLGDPHCLDGTVFGITVATGQVTTESPFGLAGEPLRPIALAAVPGPTATLSVTAAPAAQTSTFTATATNPGGSVTGYAWDFGDGTSTTSTIPTASHVYAQPGRYIATLSTFNQGGCATALEFTGQTAFCTGKQTVGAIQTIDIAGPPSATISAPAPGQTFAQGAAVATSFACAESSFGPGLSSCVDAHGAAAPHGDLDTTIPGPHYYTVTATSEDGLTTTASIDYTVTVLDPRVTIETAHAVAIHGHINVKLGCRGGSPGTSCRGMLSLRVPEREMRRINNRRHVPINTITLARATYTIVSGRSRAIALRLTAAGNRLQARASRDRYNARAAATQSGGRAAQRTITVRL